MKTQKRILKGRVHRLPHCRSNVQHWKEAIDDWKASGCQGFGNTSGLAVDCASRLFGEQERFWEYQSKFARGMLSLSGIHV